MPAPKRRKRRARSPTAWLEFDPPVATDPRWEGWSAPLHRFLRRVGRDGLTMRELLLWGLERKLPCDPRLLIAWLELAGKAAWVNERWVLLRYERRLSSRRRIRRGPAGDSRSPESPPDAQRWAVR